MGRASRKNRKNGNRSTVAQEAIALPKTNPRKVQTSVGVQAARRPATAPVARKRSMPAFSAGEASAVFGRVGKSGGAAFASWCVAEKGLAPDAQLTESEWAPLIEEFANRPIHGHRRGPAGGTHKPNRAHLRK